MSDIKIRAATYNLRLPNPRDDENFRPHRKEAVLKQIEDIAPDILGIQEGFLEQIEFLEERLTGYSYVGQGRGGGDQDEHCAVFYNSRRWEAEESDTFWLSSTPKEPASNDWDGDHPRVVTWTKLHEKATDNRVIFINTHFSLQPHAREKYAQAIVRFIAKKCADIPSVLCGDFNSLPKERPYEILTGMDGWRDSWTSATMTEGPEITFHGWKSFSLDGRNRIDWILTSQNWEVERVATMCDEVRGRLPSDHFAVVADLRLKK